MKPVRDGYKKNNQEKWKNRDREIPKRSTMSKIIDDSDDLMEEAFQGAEEDMDDEGKPPVRPKRTKMAARHSESMVNEGGHS